MFNVNMKYMPYVWWKHKYLDCGNNFYLFLHVSTSIHFTVRYTTLESNRMVPRSYLKNYILWDWVRQGPVWWKSWIKDFYATSQGPEQRAHHFSLSWAITVRRHILQYPYWFCKRQRRSWLVWANARAIRACVVWAFRVGLAKTHTIITVHFWTFLPHLSYIFIISIWLPSDVSNRFHTHVK